MKNIDSLIRRSKKATNYGTYLVEFNDPNQIEVAHHEGSLAQSMLPEDLKTPEDRLNYCIEHNIRTIFDLCCHNATLIGINED